MLVSGWPTYCGGRIITGLFVSSDMSDGEMGYRILDPNAPVGGKPQGIPQTFEVFAWILRKQLTLNGNINTPNQVGTLMAVTNRQQELAAGFLEKLGFKCAAYNEKVTGYGKCKTWIGDFHRDVWPILVTVEEPKCIKDYREALEERKRKAMSNQLKDPVRLDQWYPGMTLWFVKNNSLGGSAYGKPGDEYIVDRAGPQYFSGRLAKNGGAVSAYPKELSYYNPNAPKAVEEKGLGLKKKSSSEPVPMPMPEAPMHWEDAVPMATTAPMPRGKTYAIKASKIAPMIEPVRISERTGKPVRQYTKRAKGWL